MGLDLPGRPWSVPLTRVVAVLWQGREPPWGASRDGGKANSGVGGNRHLRAVASQNPLRLEQRSAQDEHLSGPQLLLEGLISAPRPPPGTALSIARLIQAAISHLYPERQTSIKAKAPIIKGEHISGRANSVKTTCLSSRRLLHLGYRCPPGGCNNFPGLKLGRLLSSPTTPFRVPRSPPFHPSPELRVRAQLQLRTRALGLAAIKRHGRKAPGALQSLCCLRCRVVLPSSAKRKTC